MHRSVTGLIFLDFLPIIIRNLIMMQMSSNILTGPLPTQLGQLTNLELIELGDNNFSGSIPTEIGLMVSLSSVDLRGNSLTGPIPSEIGLITYLTEIRLDGNNFTGTIPAEVVSIEGLRVLTFSGSLTGDIPDHIQTLVPCVLCNCKNYELIDSSNSHVLYKSDSNDVSCGMLLDKQQDAEQPMSVNECKLLKETCVVCSLFHKVSADNQTTTLKSQYPKQTR